MTNFCANCLHEASHNGGDCEDEGVCTHGGCNCRNFKRLGVGDLIVKFSGHMIVKKKDRPDDRGSLSHWLVNEFEQASNECESTDEVFDRLHLDLELGAVEESKAYSLRWEGEED